MIKLLLCALLVCLHLLPLKAVYPLGGGYGDAPAGVEFEMCGGRMVCRDGSYPWDDGYMLCCPHTDSTAFCCRKDDPFTCYIKQIAHEIKYKPPTHHACCYNCPMGTGQYYGISDSSETGSDEMYGKADKALKKVKIEQIHSASHELPLHLDNADATTKKADSEQGRAAAEEPAAAAAPDKAVTPITEPKPTPAPSQPPVDYSDEDNKEGVFETCKAKDLATFYVDENTVCCVGSASSQCCLKDRTDLCATQEFGAIEPIRGLNREVLTALDFSPDCAQRRAPAHMMAFLRPVDLQTQLVGASVRVSQVEGCNVRVLMAVHANYLPAGYDYAFNVGNSTICGDADDNNELLVTLPVNMRHERFRVPSSLASVRDLRGHTLTVYRLDANKKSEAFACGRFL